MIGVDFEKNDKLNHRQFQSYLKMLSEIKSLTLREWEIVNLIMLGHIDTKIETC